MAPELFFAANDFRRTAQRALMNVLKHRFPLQKSPAARVRFARRSVNANASPRGFYPT
jgi:hypothetical protein